MGTELLGPCFKEDSMEISSIPPGFESLAAKRMEDNQDSTNSGSSCASNAQNITSETQCDNSKNSSSFCRRSGMKYKKHDSNSSDHIEFEQNISRNWLPKGVIRGCEACGNCQKVKAKWRPEESRRPDLEEAPVFYPSKEEFEDTLKYISSIRPQAEKYGICRIVPPPSWSPPCPLKENNIWKWSEFSTRVQRVDKLQNRDTMRKLLEANRDKKRKRRRCLRREVDNGNITQDIKISGDVGWSQAESFGFEPGPDFTLDAFQKYDDDFKAQYFREYYNNSNSGGNRIMPEQLGPAVEDIEGEYWRIVETPTEEIEVLYGADLDTGAFGSGFPKNSQQVASASDSDYINSGWNLNNFPRLPGSVLSFESSDISGVVVPWLYVGMCFSSFCWHVEDHHMYSLNYMHWGAPKMWYGVPGSGAVKLEAAMRKHLPDLFEEQPDLLHKLVTQLSPSILRSEGVTVYRCIQNAGEFVLTFPRAYHAGFNCGFNCAEAVNIAPVDWLPHGQTAVELYREQGRRTSISHDKLLLGSARESVKANWECDLLRKYNSNNLRWKEVCGKDGILSRTLKNRVEMERMWREFLSESSQVLTMESSFDANSERECTVCFFDLHLSAVGCHHCSPNKYACLKHAKELCSCSWGARFFLFRYDISELNMLVEALEGNLSALYRWARRDMGFSLTSYVARKNAEIHTSQGSVSKEVSSPTEEQEKQVHGGSLNITKYTGDAGSSRIVRPPMVVLALPCVRTSNRYSQQVKSAKSSIPCEKDNSLQPPPAHKLQSSQVGRLKLAASDHSEGSHLSFSEHKGVIVLSDDEEDEPSKKLCVRKGTSHNHTITMVKPVFPDNTTNLGGCINESPLTNSPCVKVPSTDVDSKKDDSGKKGTRESDEANAQCPQVQIDERKSNGEDGNKRSELDVEFRSVDNMLTVSSPTSHQTDLDRCHRQKGPRIAKVVRRIKCKVEALDFGTVRAGKLWCDSRAIYPKGFRSRVRYIDVVDPTSMCHYVSEILDAGLEGPLFMVSVEHSPNEVFIHTSANRCWELVRQRVNQEIMKQHKLGKGKLPPLQPFGSVDGMEMFGFSSPAILQVIQSKDQNRVCTEYWQSHPPIQIPTQPQSVDNSAETIPEPLARKSHAEVETTLNSLFEKANPEELHTLYSLLNNKSSADEQRLLSRLLSEKINKQSI